MVSYILHVQLLSMLLHVLSILNSRQPFIGLSKCDLGKGWCGNLNLFIQNTSMAFVYLQHNQHLYVHAIRELHPSPPSHSYMQVFDWHLMLSECSLRLGILYHSLFFAHKGGKQQPASRACIRVLTPYPKPDWNQGKRWSPLGQPHPLTLVKVRWLGQGRSPKGAAYH